MYNIDIRNANDLLLAYKNISLDENKGLDLHAFLEENNKKIEEVLNITKKNQESVKEILDTIKKSGKVTTIKQNVELSTLNGIIKLNNKEIDNRLKMNAMALTLLNQV